MGGAVLYSHCRCRAGKDGSHDEALESVGVFGHIEVVHRCDAHGVCVDGGFLYVFRAGGNDDHNYSGSCNNYNTATYYYDHDGRTDDHIHDYNDASGPGRP